VAGLRKKGGVEISERKGIKITNIYLLPSFREPAWLFNRRRHLYTFGDGIPLYTSHFRFCACFFDQLYLNLRMRDDVVDSHIAASDRLDYLYLKNMLSDLDCTDRTAACISYLNL